MSQSPYGVPADWYMSTTKAETAGFTFSHLHDWLPTLVKTLVKSYNRILLNYPIADDIFKTYSDWSGGLATPWGLALDFGASTTSKAAYRTSPENVALCESAV